MASVAGGSTPGELQTAAARDYGLEWRSLDQIRRRATWLRITGMIERQFDGRFILTEAGKFSLNIQNSPIQPSCRIELLSLWRVHHWR
jgi:hypothetical protein